jgi:hypothetical protein
MTHEEKINYMRISAGICHFGFTNEQLDLLTSLYDLVLKNKGETNMEQVITVEHEVKKRAEERIKDQLPPIETPQP